MQRVIINGRHIEYRQILGDVSAGPPLVFLHEGLGCTALWRDFPDRIARSLGVPALVYSRLGYGGSDGLDGPRTTRFMHEEALDILPRLLDHMSIHAPLLIGHSDGASIALIHAASAARPVAGLVLMAPHVMVEAICVESIARIRETFAKGDLRGRLSRYHTHVDDAFYGWADIWLDPTFRSWSLTAEVGQLRAPCLVIQGEDDEYGTLAQVQAITDAAPHRVETLILPRCGHSPQRDCESETAKAIVDFAVRLARAA